MKVLVVGTGAREHALAASVIAGGDSVVVAPGNAGIARECPVAAVDTSSPAAVAALASSVGADLTVVGPEAVLATGVADRFAADGRLLFGPTAAASAIETSKVFAKHLMARHGVPTARAEICDSAATALDVVREGRLGWPVVVKADGLAGGKGVVVAANRAEAEAAVHAAMVDNVFGAAGARVVLEECLVGPEVSYFVIAAGDRFVACGTAQDHKRLLDGDRGPNTGGMGAFSPSTLVDDALAERIEREIVSRVLGGMAADGSPFTGFLYCGLMLTAEGPKVIEFNCRFGDPEAQVVLPRLGEPLAPLLARAAAGEPLPAAVSFTRDVAVGVVIASAGYPGPLDTGHLITGLDRVAVECPRASVRFAGVAASPDGLVASGGRVLTVVGHAPQHREAVALAYDAVSRIHFSGMQYRSDIGVRASARPTAG